MSFLFADRKKQIAVVNKPTDSNLSGLFMTGSLDLLNHASVAGLANSTLVGNLSEAANLIYPTARGSLIYENGLVIEGLPHIALSPSIGSVVSSARINGIGVGLGYSVNSVGTRIYNKPGAVIDIMAANADVKITGGQLSSAGTASLIMVGAKASVGTISGFKFDVSRSNIIPTVDNATLFVRPYNVNTNLPALVSMNYDGNVGIGTSSPNNTLHVVSSQPSVSAVSIENDVGPGLTVKTNAAAPLRVITGYPNTEAIALYVSSSGILGVKMDTSTVSVPTGVNTALAVNGSVWATNAVYAFGSFTYSSGVFEKKDSFNVDGIVATPSGSNTTWTISFINSIVDYNASTGYTVLVSENSGQKLYTNVSSMTADNFTIVFTDADANNITSQQFSFAVFYNPSSLYQTASNVQTVF